MQQAKEDKLNTWVTYEPLYITS